LHPLSCCFARLVADHYMHWLWLLLIPHGAGADVVRLLRSEGVERGRRLYHAITALTQQLRSGIAAASPVDESSLKRQCMQLTRVAIGLRTTSDEV
jgi:hypothetical protein